MPSHFFLFLFLSFFSFCERGGGHTVQHVSEHWLAALQVLEHVHEAKNLLRGSANAKIRP